MAIDNAEKRKSISGIWMGLPGVTSNAAKDAEWRLQVGWSYSGITVDVSAGIAEQIGLRLLHQAGV